MADTGFTWAWERDAMAYRDLPEGLPVHDQMAYLAMREIYRAYKSGHIDRETAAREKRQVRYAYDTAAAAFDFQRKLTAHYAALNKRTEAARTAVRKNPTPENARRLVDVMDGLDRREVAP